LLLIFYFKAAKSSSFFLDLGDYEDDFIVLETRQGEQISQLLGGYIDLLLKRQRNDDEEIALEESLASPKLSSLSEKQIEIERGDTRSNFITIKVKIISLNRIIAMRFALDAPIGEVCSEVSEKTNTGGKDHGLFQPSPQKPSVKPRWLAATRSFRFYDIENGVSLISSNLSPFFKLCATINSLFFLPSDLVGV